MQKQKIVFSKLNWRTLDIGEVLLVRLLMMVVLPGAASVLVHRVA